MYFASSVFLTKGLLNFNKIFFFLMKYGSNNFIFIEIEKEKKNKRKEGYSCLRYATSPQQVLQIEDFPNSLKLVKPKKRKKERKIRNVGVSAIRSVAGDPA